EPALAHQTADPHPAPIALSQRQDWRLHWDIGHDASFPSSQPRTRMRLLHKRPAIGLLLSRWAGLLHTHRHGRGCLSEATRDLLHAGCGACLTGGYAYLPSPTRSTQVKARATS